MINLHTGLPGSGKTLRSVSLIEKRRIAENRAVYYTGIEEVTLEGWLPMPDPHKWYELPPGAILYFGEVQKVWPKRPSGAAVPESEAMFETHRHRGYDVYFDTQDPGFIDAHLRKLVQTHFHMMRKFGSPWVTVHQFEGVRDNVSKTRKDSIESQWLNDKSMYGKYKSAEIHTNKIRIPPKVLIAALLPFVLAWLAYSFYQRRINAHTVPDTPTAAAGPAVASSALPAAPVVASRTYDLAAFAPRIEGLPHTAPRYDALTAPVRVPVIAGCVWFDKSQRGHCYTQQGTLLTPPADFIKQYIAKGMFEDFDRGQDLIPVVAGAKPPDAARPISRPQAAPVPAALQ
ncbi:MAG: zonular occludens toxin domain-containing protein [Polaromonas sp.]|nr:zonular occludens toxin domain-containing protein [Polaromonas sp.]